MSFFKIKLHAKNYLLIRQEYIGFVAVLVEKIIATFGFMVKDVTKLRVFDFYLRFNSRASRTSEVFKKAVVLSKSCSALVTAGIKKPNVLNRSIIIKEYVNENEKGVLLVTFESELVKLAASPQLSEIEKNFSIVFGPTWQPFFCVEFYYFLANISQQFWINPSSERDRELCEYVGPLCMPLPFQSSSWVDGDSYGDTPRNKDIDIIMLANFSKYKRHWLLFEALRNLPPELNVVIAGRPLGSRNSDTLRAEAACFGVADRFHIIENPSNEMVIDLLARSKLFCALSHKEGSYIAIAEALFAGTPVGIYEDAIVGSKDYINPETGVLFTRKLPLSTQISNFLAQQKRYDTTKWAKANISARVNSQKMNQLLKEHSLTNGKCWTIDIASFYCKNFDFIYYESNAVPEDAYRNFNNTYGIELPYPAKPASIS